MDIPEVPVLEYRQKKDWSCGPAALKILLSSRNHEVSEEQLIQLTGAKPEGGVEHEGMTRAAQMLGYKVFATANATEKQVLYFLQNRIPVIVDYQGNIGGHYAVITGYDNGRVIFQDPREEGSLHHSMDWQMFQHRWYNIRYDTHERIDRWMMVIL